MSRISVSVRLSENHAPASLAKSVDLPMPCGPFRMRTESNLIPGWYILATAAASVFLMTALVYTESSAPR